MDYQTAISQVLGIVKRPDKLAEIKWAVNAAIADMVRTDKFSYDLYQFDYTIPVATQADTVQTILYSAFTGPTPRHIESIITDTDIKPYTEILPKNIVKGGMTRCGVFYKRNDGMLINMRATATTIKISYYAAPPVLVNDTDTHWTLDQALAAIVARACQYTFSTIGEDRDTATWERKALIAYDRVAQELT